MEHWNIGFISTFIAWNGMAHNGTLGTPNKKREV